MSTMRIVALVVSMLCMIGYGAGVYCTYIDGAAEFDKEWHNNERLNQGGLSKRDIQTVRATKRVITKDL